MQFGLAIVIPAILLGAATKVVANCVDGKQETVIPDYEVE